MTLHSRTADSSDERFLPSHFGCHNAADGPRHGRMRKLTSEPEYQQILPTRRLVALLVFNLDFGSSCMSTIAKS
ncbi:hypothetical protein TNIN_41271 [Trichonephila inaurata madagascariensis]|uniref:Uncharacterized protein n=1 Tax=Trichonephila inaurata madagascariensis TaxID=2747483 RepID=A0A8X7CN67_9ARAC|nr:hypothetical protein TNIN_41271 [Trichonephila inaurata madagascariensis]